LCTVCSRENWTGVQIPCMGLNFTP
jgi:hypothetical protein